MHPQHEDALVGPASYLSLFARRAFPKIYMPPQYIRGSKLNNSPGRTRLTCGHFYFDVFGHPSQGPGGQYIPWRAGVHRGESMQDKRLLPPVYGETLILSPHRLRASPSSLEKGHTDPLSRIKVSPYTGGKSRLYCMLSLRCSPALHGF